MAPTDLNKIIYPWLRDATEYSFDDIKEGIRLHLNESPYPPPDFVIENVEKYLRKGNNYQHPDLVERLRELQAEYSKVEPEYVLPTPGGDGALRSIFFNLTQPGDTLVLNYPSYSMYPVYASVRGLNVVRIKLKEEGEWWKEDLDKLYEVASKARLIVIDDPNNPTGSPMLQGKAEIISALAESAKGLVVLDEAYYEFSKYTAKDLVYKYENLAIVRTLSKAFSLASYRIGYLIADKEVIKALRKSTTPFDIALPSLIAGITALENPSYALRIAEEIRQNREFLLAGLRKMGLKAYNSLTNFVLFKYDKDLLHPLMNKGIAIRRPMEGYYRVTVGTLDQVKVFLEKLGEVIEDSRSE
ncbi:MAG: histidinol-phosphate transaminase [Candidatus Aramenus sp.]|nr:histidinol-phosphate transaminase [Candidatus Aramenus sp.]